jgi:hypothetical protein
MSIGISLTLADSFILQRSALCIGNNASIGLVASPNFSAPIQFEEFAPCLAWWKKREENE